jgi:uncharacterized SAM-binding protein YcdF (DUF218 family)
VPAEEAPVTSAGRVARGRTGRRRRWRRWLIALAVLIVLFLGATARLFVWPDRGLPPTVSAIVSLDVPYGAVNVAIRLAEQHRAPYLVVSLGRPQSSYGCPAPVAGVRLICFNPNPATTQGEAEYVGRLARRYHWRSVGVVTITPQDTRARLRMSRCFDGPVYVRTTPIPGGAWPHQLAYEWGALFKALVLQRSC